MNSLLRVRVALFAALGVVGCKDVELGAESESEVGSTGDGERPCEPKRGELLLCFSVAGDECPVCEDPQNECTDRIATDAGPGAETTMTCGPALGVAGGVCCLRYLVTSQTVEGRPFTVAGSARTAKAATRCDWATRSYAHPDANARAAWVQRGLDEHASVASFARFVLELLGVGAPPDLVADAIEAMRDEVEHARSAFGVAAALGGTPVGPGPLRTSDATLARSLEDVAISTLTEGAIGETFAAVRAAEEAAREADPSIRAVLETIAADETRHAALAWRFLRWALSTSPELRGPLQHALDSAVGGAGPGSVAELIIRPCWRSMSGDFAGGDASALHSQA